MARKEKIRPPSQIEYPKITAGGYKFFQQIAGWVNSITGFSYRGDATTDFDLTYFQTAPLATDGAYHTFSLATIVPADARNVYLRASIQSDVADAYIGFRRVGYSNEGNVFRLTTPYADTPITGYCIVNLTPAITIEFKAENVTWDSINVTVCGWFI